MISVEAARGKILDSLTPVGTETVALSQALGRVTAVDLTARRTQPPRDMSAMDGYAVRAADVASVPVALKVVAEVPAGHAFDGAVPPGSCVRIFTGAPLPADCDTVIIQEDTDADEAAGTVTVREGAAKGTYVRPAGLDFRDGEILIEAGTRLTARHVGLAAAMDIPWIAVRRKPRVAILSTGDEIVLPGDPIAENQIVSSNGPALAAAVTVAGGEPTLLSNARDDADALRDVARGAVGHDLLLTTGGASVGKHDLVGSALGDAGLTLDFWKIAMRPGKPLMYGSLDGIPMLGLPGNPVSALVCFLLFGAPAIGVLSGLPAGAPPFATARLTAPLPQNDQREDYLRGTLSRDSDGTALVTPFPKQDSSMMRRLAQADCLIRRAPHAQPAPSGEPVDIVPFSLSHLAY